MTYKKYQSAIIGINNNFKTLIGRFKETCPAHIEMKSDILQFQEIKNNLSLEQLGAL